MYRKRILLTGAAGRVGRLLRPFLNETHALRLADINPVETVAADDEILQGDLADPELATRAVAGTVGVVHLAGLVARAVSFEDTLSPNYRALLSLLEACRHTGVDRFVFASSHHVFGLHPPGPLPDGALPAPDGFYGLSKAFGEAACAMYSGRFGLRVLIVRIGNADPEVPDGRRERLWVSGRDLAQLVRIGLEHPSLRLEVVAGVSDCPDSFLSTESARRLGYRPQDRPQEHRSATFRPLSEMTAADGADRVGGLFAAVDLPPPFDRT